MQNTTTIANGFCIFLTTIAPNLLNDLLNLLNDHFGRLFSDQTPLLGITKI